LTNNSKYDIINTSKGRKTPTNQKGIDTMANQKLTKAQKFALLKEIPAVAENSVLVEFIDHELELLAKKNSAEKKPTAQQTANEGIKSAIVEGMEEGKLYTITDLIKSIPTCAELTNQRVSNLVRQLIAEGKVVRTEEKRKAYFSLA
jgi:hypothetical protein